MGERSEGSSTCGNKVRENGDAKERDKTGVHDPRMKSRIRVKRSCSPDVHSEYRCVAEPQERREGDDEFTTGEYNEASVDLDAGKSLIHGGSRVGVN